MNAWIRSVLALVMLVLAGGDAAGAPTTDDYARLNDLPLVEVLPPASTAQGGDEVIPFALLLSGDGGWAGIDKDVSAALAARGMRVVGLNTLRYFWKARTPEETAADVARTLEHYSAAWSRPRCVLIGYSLGADVLPFVVNRLPAALRERISALVLISLSHSAVFEVHVAGWLPGVTLKGQPTAPEIDKLDVSRALCLYGAGEPDSLCPELAQRGVQVEQIGSGHHLGGQYDVIARRILDLSAARAVSQ